MGGPTCPGSWAGPLARVLCKQAKNEAKYKRFTERKQTAMDEYWLLEPEFDEDDKAWLKRDWLEREDAPQ